MKGDQYLYGDEAADTVDVSEYDGCMCGFCVIKFIVEKGGLVPVEPVEKYYAVPNDLIGGWDVSEYNKPVGDHGEHEFSIGSFMSKECAEQVARAMNLLAGIGGGA